MELLILWAKGKREWSNIKNVKQDCQNLVNKYIKNKVIKLESSKRKIMLRSESFKESEDGKNKQLREIFKMFLQQLSHKINLNHRTITI